MTAPPPPERAVIDASRALVGQAAAALVSAMTAGGRAEALSDEARAIRAETRELRRAMQDGRDGQGDGLPALREHLRDGVRHYAVALRAAGAPPERMLRLVKEAVAPALRSGRRDERLSRISDDVVRWSLDAYFAA